jgi:uncharacterized protein YaaQ
LLSALTQVGFAVDTLPSVGGFLGSRNVTLVVGLPAGREEAALRAIKRAAHGKVEFTDAVLPRADVPMPQPVPVQVGGATIFMFDVDSYEEF